MIDVEHLIHPPEHKHSDTLEMPRSIQNIRRGLEDMVQGLRDTLERQLEARQNTLGHPRWL